MSVGKAEGEVLRAEGVSRVGGFWDQHARKGSEKFGRVLDFIPILHYKADKYLRKDFKGSLRK